MMVMPVCAAMTMAGNMGPLCHDSRGHRQTGGMIVLIPPADASDSGGSFQSGFMFVPKFPARFCAKQRISGTALVFVRKGR